MAQNENYIGISMGLDVSDLKSGLSEANKRIQLANSEFKAAASGMDDWAKSTAGLNAKTKQLDTVLKAQESKLAGLNAEYEKVVQEQGDSSEAARKLKVQINNQQAVVNKTRREFDNYSETLQAAESGTIDLQNVTLRAGKVVKNLGEVAQATDDDLIKLADAEFENAVSGMEDWQKSTEGLQKKVRQLDQTLDAQKNTLNTLEQEYAAVAREQGEGSAAAVHLKTQIEQQKTTVASTQTEFNNYYDTLNDAVRGTIDLEEVTLEAGRAVANTGEEAKDAESGFTVLKGAVAGFIANTLSALVSKLGEAIGYLGSFGDEAKKAFNGFAASTGTTAAEMEKFEDAIKNIYNNNFGESFEDIADAMATIKQQAGDIGADELEKMTQNALMLRDTFDFDVSESMRAVSELMKEFGISADDAFNLIAQGAQNGLNKNGDLLDVINEYSVHYKLLGLSSEEFFNSLSSGAETGTFSVDKLGDAMKEFGIRVKDGSDSSAAAFEYLGYDADALFKAFNEGGEDAAIMTKILIDELADMPDSVEKTTAGVALFGTMWEDLGANTIGSLSQMNGSISQTTDALSQINEVKYDSVGEAITGIKRNLETGILMPISDKVLPIVNDLAAKFQEWLSDPKTQESIANLSESIAKLAEDGMSMLSEGIKSAIDSFDDVIDAFQWILDNKDSIADGLVAIGAGFAAFKVVTLIQGVTKALNGMTVAQWALNAAQNANPIGIIVALLAALVAGFIYAWNNIDGFKEFWIGLWETVKGAFTTAFEAVGTFLTETIPEWFNSFVAWLSGVWESIKEIFSSVVDFVKENWAGLLLLIANPFLGAFKLLYDNCEAFRTFVDEFVESVKTFFVNAWNAIVEFFTVGIPEFIENVKQWFADLPEKLGYLIGALIGIVASFFIDLWQFATEDIPEFIGEVVKWFSELPGRIWEWLVNAATKVKEWGTDIYEKGNAAVTNFLAKAVEVIKGLPGKIWTWLVNAASNVYKWGVDIIEKGKKATSDFIDKAIEIIKGLPGRIWEWLKNAAGKVVEWGVDLASKGKEAATELFDTIVDKIKEIPDEMLSLGKDIVEGLWNGINSMVEWIGGKIKSFGDGVLSGIKDFFDINSPSKVMADEVGKYIGQGVGVGVLDSVPFVKRKLNKFSGIVSDSLGGIKAGLSGFGVSGAGTNIDASMTVHYNGNLSRKQLKQLEIDNYNSVRMRLKAEGAI
jgi:phage-related minor tail protein